MDNKRVEYIHRFDQMTGAFRETAAALAVFRDALTEKGFTDDGAEELTEILFSAVLAHDE